MEKELEEIRDDKLRIGLLGLKRLFETNKEKISKDEIMAFDFTFMNITKALTELQAIKEVKPSEALKKLEEIRERFSDDSKGNNSWGFKISQELNTIKQTLLNAQEQEKVLEIIKEKRVNIGRFYFVVFILKKDYESCKLNNNNVMYNICDTEKDFLTEEEFDLLKRWQNE